MIDFDKKIHCPVCCMQVKPENLFFEFNGLKFYFCSRQCQQRFEKNPYLYTARRGEPSTRQRGAVVYKKRMLKLDEPVPDELAQIIIQAVSEMMGIRNISITRDTIEISYDLLQATAEQIESTLEQAGKIYQEKHGNILANSWSEKIKRAFIHYLEETELDNLEEDDRPQCHD